MDIQEVAAALDGVQYRDEDSRYDRNELRDAGIVVAFGASDDLMEFRGAVYDEVGAYDGGSAKFTSDGLVEAPECDCEAAEKLHAMQSEGAVEVRAIWCPDDGTGASWKFETNAPHATFKVMEEDDLYCIGVVFSLGDLGASA